MGDLVSASAAALPPQTEMGIGTPLRDDCDPSPSRDEKPSWFSPMKLLVIFSVINLLNYVDRGVIASNGVNGSRKTCTKSGICTPGSGIQGDFDLSNFEDGVLSSAFMVGLLVASPIFASLAKSFNPFRLIGVGLSVWTFAAAGCGCAINFWMITIFRMMVSVGEASLINLAAPFIDDNAPVSQKTAWLATFYMCIPSGIALGYVYGGVVGNNLHWRYAFWGEALLMLPFAILGFAVKPLQLKGFTLSKPKKEVFGEIDVADGEHNPKPTVSADCADTRARNTVSNNLFLFWRDEDALGGKSLHHKRSWLYSLHLCHRSFFLLGSEVWTWNLSYASLWCNIYRGNLLLRCLLLQKLVWIYSLFFVLGSF